MSAAPTLPARSAHAREGGGLIDWRDTVATHYQSVWWYLRLLGADPALADDLTQDTFVAVLHAGPKLTVTSAGAYLRKSARSVFLRAVQRRRLEPVAVEDLDATDATWDRLHAGDGDLCDAQVVDALRECVRGLQGRSREVIERHYRDHQSQREIAESLGVGEGNLRVIVHRVRVALKRCIERKAVMP